MRIRRVRAVSTGERRTEAIVEAETAIARALLGAVELRMSAVGSPPRDAAGMSSGMPRRAERSERRNVSRVRRTMLYMKVVLAAFQTDAGPDVVHSWDNTSSKA